ncbi:MAG: class I SAM-dependent methyltransferase [Treponema sp.]|jgi:2-polyprenyl-3-methyl-5-hydroxy-6-metoxy-1,4-benzoquinol methylase|nr:class I SAM-dependent methyltransferase [Treponema sp.]
MKRFLFQAIQTHVTAEKQSSPPGQDFFYRTGGNSITEFDRIKVFNKILVVPAFEKGRGGGHLARSLVLVRDLRKAGREAWLYLPHREAADRIPALTEGFDNSWIILQDLTQSGKPTGKNWDFIVLDRFKTTGTEFAFWSKLAPLIGIDEGGPCRDRFNFLIDLLPGLPNKTKPNIQDPSLNPLPKNRRSPLGILTAKANKAKKEREEKIHSFSSSFFSPSSPSSPYSTLRFTFFDSSSPPKILISFGAEDAAGLGGAVYEVLEKTFFKNAGLEKPRLIPDLAEHLAEYDILITHFGLTAFEALHAGLLVILVSPTRYHEKLAKNAGFYSAGIGPTSARRLNRLFSEKSLTAGFLQKLSQRCADITAKYGLDKPPAQSLADLINTFSPMVYTACPACGRTPQHLHPPPFTSLETAACRPCCEIHPSFPFRFPDRTYRRCKHCGMVYLDRLTPPPIEYAKDYFFDFYKKQYGKTYIEDFPNIIAAGKERLNYIKALKKSSAKIRENPRTNSSPGIGSNDKNPRLLDIGCAYGPFLAAARDEGFSPVGMDPAEDAVAYVRNVLKIEAHTGFFPDTPLPEVLADTGFDVVTMWFVIEHFRDFRRVLDEIRRILKPGGVLAFSTPSFSGISRRSSLAAFLEKSPADHFTIWSPHCRKILKQAGFHLRRVRVTGHHPERFPGIGKFAIRQKGLIYRLIMLISCICGLGDTFEAYAVVTKYRNFNREGE